MDASKMFLIRVAIGQVRAQALTCHFLSGKLMVLCSLEAGFPIGRPGNVFLSETGRQYMHLVLMHNTLVVLMIEVIFQL